MTPRAFGEKVAASVDWQKLLSGARRGVLTGAAAGGLRGIFFPGEEATYDDAGNVIGKKRRGRFGALVRGALGGAAIGSATGAALNYMSPRLVDQIEALGRRGYDTLRRKLTNKTQAQLTAADSVRRLNPEQRELHDQYVRGLRRTNMLPRYSSSAPGSLPPVMMLDPEPWESGHRSTDEEVAKSEAHLGDYSNATWPMRPNMGLKNLPNVNPNNLTDAELDELGTR